ncbi:anti-phage ZorAB system protein ZorA [uncultured Herbaspirillum sp.]|uniref:anti-phage ZorAB system protein ZorA n=1 Tax=uncultured Herbaspirillum sp. TaxID=160236 RepID=UPI00258A07F9|nr:anti-phage ZorAB system protein ZorA [uncultured Herbaspirillum sp.]
MNSQSLLDGVPASVIITTTLLALFFVAFLVAFLVPSLMHAFRLRRILNQLSKLDKNAPLKELRKVFSQDGKLAHLWSEYQESLHRQYEQNDGQLVERSARATLPAEMFFNAQVVVDSRLGTEFFKHLPGIFTGIGIIGTFFGLIDGLRAFKVSENAALVRTSLESLMHSVGEAFHVSAFAIGAAMLVTFLEKLLLAALYRYTDEIAHDIDARFESGAGEEYLSRLVKASEESASQSKILKDALVQELGELLRELTSAQIAASAKSAQEQVEVTRLENQALGKTIAESIQQSLKAPLEDIANTVKSASGDQSASAVSMLQDVMASFSQRLNDLFGGQISGLSDLNQQTARSIQEAVGSLQALVSNMEASSQRSADAMAERMAQAVEKMESRQEAMNAQSAAFIEQIRQLVASSQSETNQHLHATLESVGKQMATMIANLNESQAQVFESNRAREQSMSDRASEAVSVMSHSVDSVVKELGAAATKMAQSVATLGNATSASIDKLNAGAELLGTASRNFASAGERVSGVLDQTATVSGKLAEAAGALTSGSSALQELLRDYRLQRDAMGHLVTELRSVVDSAHREATLTGDVLSRIEGAATRLGNAQKMADEYLDGVSKVLGEAHNSFATEVTRTLSRANTEFHSKLVQSVGLLSSAVEELGVTLMSMGNQIPARG